MTEARAPRGHHERLERVQRVPRPLDEVFAFFEDARNLEAITPPFLRFRILTSPPITMSAGALIDYRLHLFGVPLRWRTRIESYEPGRSFVDVQIAGPYRLWRHLHEFTPVPGGTEIRDRVDYTLPFGPLGRLVHRAFVKRTLARIFDYRRDTIDRLFRP